MSSPPPDPTSSHDVVSDDVVELAFEFAGLSHFPVTLSADESCLVRLERSVRRDTDRVDGYFTVQGTDSAAVHEQAERTSADPVRVVYEGESELMFQLDDIDCHIEQTLEAAGAVPRVVRVRDGTVTASALVPASVAVRDVVEYVFERYPSAELVKRRPRDLPAPVVTRDVLRQLIRKRLTDRQWEVLQMVYRYGYWDRPRGHTGEEIAVELGITSATLSQHVRAGCRNVFDVLFDEYSGTDDR